MFRIYVKNQQTGAKYIADTAPDAYIADRKAVRIMRELDTDHVAYIEPTYGWPAEEARSAAIAAEWQTWRRVHGS